ncbi:hypothetical protein BIW53_03345 [Pseudoalteromonas byunsanensis]|uniref:Uncharacterized protein n=2 Tax=Pseudoalteromonas byunsanensis TaxID=327939 RepID=A0A1S1NC52_9GAMM|nr:hypothetical protein BIW53_03345 [Pseudoalteromonas byunsanensis]
MGVKLESLTEQRLAWFPTKNAEYPLQAELKGVTYTVRINDFPEEPMYSIICENEVIGDLDDWPSNWDK